MNEPDWSSLWAAWKEMDDDYWQNHPTCPHGNPEGCCGHPDHEDDPPLMSEEEYLSVHPEPIDFAQWLTTEEWNKRFPSMRFKRPEQAEPQEDSVD